MTKQGTHQGTGEWYERDGHLVLGAMVRTLGAFPSGWRYPGAHSDPRADPRALKRLARAAEKAGLDFLFFGDWLSTTPDLEFSDPYLLARVDPLSTASYLAGLTRRIGLVGTVSTTHSEPYTVARTAASIDRLSGGRFALNLTVGTDPRAAANFGRAGSGVDNDRFDVAEEYVEVLRGLWDSWDERAFVRDTDRGVLIDRSLVSPLDHAGRTYAVAGPLNVPRPVQGHVPLVHAGMSVRAREFAAEHADIYLIAPSSLGEAVKFYRDTKLRVAAHGRGAAELSIVAPILPITGRTRAEAHAVYDRLVELLPIDDESARPARLELPPNRSIRTICQLVGLPLAARRPDEVLVPETAERFNDFGVRLIELVTERSGRTIGGDRPITYRHLLVAHIIRGPVVVGAPADIADHLEAWYRSSAVDGFTVQSAFLHEQFETFADLVVPELRSRGLFRDEYRESTLRGHLGSTAPARNAPRTSVRPAAL